MANVLMRVQLKKGTDDITEYDLDKMTFSNGNNKYSIEDIEAVIIPVTEFKKVVGKNKISKQNQAETK